MPTAKKLIALLIPAIVVSVRAWKRIRPKATMQESKNLQKPHQTAEATQRYLLYCMIPLWVASGFLDYVWHRKTSIETTSGPTESIIHLLMMSEAGLPMVLGLLLEVNAGVILLMMTAFFVHAGTAIWDVSFAVERRKVTPTEQHIHSFLEVLPFCAVSFIICLHPAQFAALFGLGKERARFEFKRKTPPLSPSYFAGLLGGIAINTTAYADELIRCIRAKQKGLTGVNTPRAARELYGQ